MKKYCKDLTIVASEHLSPKHLLIKLTDDEPLPEMKAGQFVELLITRSATTFLRRPISINYFDQARNEMWLLVAMVGNGTRSLEQFKVGDKLNVLFPLGNGFSDAPLNTPNFTPLLIGGGVGIAPLFFLGSQLKQQGIQPKFLLGARSATDLLEVDLFRNIADVYITTEDASEGEKGFVTNHSILQRQHFDRLYVCGPKPMMVAVARYATQTDTPCEVSLENMMACGLGACLCCVEKTVAGNKRVCQDGPVFNIKELLW